MPQDLHNLPINSFVLIRKLRFGAYRCLVFCPDFIVRQFQNCYLLRNYAIAKDIFVLPLIGKA